MPTVIINGKAVSVPGSATPEELVRASGRQFNSDTRSVVKIKTGSNTRMKPGQREMIRDGEQFKIVPDRVKAANATYFGNKEPWRKQVITELIFEVAKKIFQEKPR